jgi:hypothetical protein
MFCQSEEVFWVRLPASDAPIILASPFTSYKDIEENAVVWTYFVWFEGRKAVRIVHAQIASQQLKVPYNRVTSTCHVKSLCWSFALLYVIKLFNAVGKRYFGT